MAGRVLGKAFGAVNHVLVHGTEGRQAGADGGDGGLDEGPDGRICVYPAAICERDAADGDDADDTDYADAEKVVRQSCILRIFGIHGEGGMGSCFILS